MKVLTWASEDSFEVQDVRLEDIVKNGRFHSTYNAKYRGISVTVHVYKQATRNFDLPGLRRLKSPYLEEILALLLVGNDKWIVCRVVVYDTLKNVLLGDPLRLLYGETEARFITLGLLLGVSYLHRNSIRNGNINPSNILLTVTGYPVLSALENCHTVVPDSNYFKPRLGFAAPEVLLISKVVRASDIYSIGAVAYFIITRRVPFEGQSKQDTLRNVLNYRILEPEFDRRIFTLKAEIFLGLCLRKFPAGRFELGVNLRNLVQVPWFQTLPIEAMKLQEIVSPLLLTMQPSKEYGLAACPTSQSRQSK